jgi:hypothetical protein
MFVYGKFEDDELPVALSDITPTDTADDDTKEAIADWHYWKQQGYQF